MMSIKCINSIATTEQYTGPQWCSGGMSTQLVSNINNNIQYSILVVHQEFVFALYICEGFLNYIAKSIRVVPPFATTTASTPLGRRSTRFRSVFLGILDHS